MFPQRVYTTKSLKVSHPYIQIFLPKCRALICTYVKISQSVSALTMYIQIFSPICPPLVGIYVKKSQNVAGLLNVHTTFFAKVLHQAFKYPFHSVHSPFPLKVSELFTLSMYSGKFVKVSDFFFLSVYSGNPAKVSELFSPYAYIPENTVNCRNYFHFA